MKTTSASLPQLLDLKSEKKTKMRCSWSTQKIKMLLFNIDVPKDVTEVGSVLKNLQAIASLSSDEKVLLEDIHAASSNLIEKRKQFAEVLESTPNEYVYRVQDEITKVIDVLRSAAIARHSGSKGLVAAMPEEGQEGQIVDPHQCGDEVLGFSAPVCAGAGRSNKDAPEACTQDPQVHPQASEAYEQKVNPEVAGSQNENLSQSPESPTVLWPTPPNTPPPKTPSGLRRPCRPLSGGAARSEAALVKDALADECGHSQAESVEKKLHETPSTSPLKSRLKLASNAERALACHAHENFMSSNSADTANASATKPFAPRPRALAWNAPLDKCLPAVDVGSRPRTASPDADWQMQTDATVLECHGYAIFPTDSPHDIILRHGSRLQSYADSLGITLDMWSSESPVNLACYGTALLSPDSATVPKQRSTSKHHASRCRDSLTSSSQSSCVSSTALSHQSKRRSLSLPPISVSPQAGRLSAEDFAAYCGMLKDAKVQVASPKIAQFDVPPRQNPVDIAVLVGRA